MKNFFFIILFAFGLCANAQEDRVSLNGYWKFNSILGDGANSLDISPSKTDIIIDNSDDSKIEYTGNWKLSKEPKRTSKMWGKDYYSKQFYTKDDHGAFRFKTGEITPGYYEHFIYFPWGHHSATIVNVNHADGIHTQPFSQRNRTGTWLSLGVFKINKKSFVELTSYSKGEVVADVVMLRPISKEKYKTTKKEKLALVKPNYNDSLWHNLKVPGHFGMLNQYANYHGKAWYRKSFYTPKSWLGNTNERIRVKFDGVYHIGRVFLNGTFLGRHQGGFTPFEFDVTDVINRDKKNVLVVEADNSYTVGATWNWGGIIRDVTLIKNEDARVKWHYIHATPDLEKGDASYEIKMHIENNSASKKSLHLNASIYKDALLDVVTTVLEIAPNSTKEIVLRGKLPSKHVSLWHFDTPELYRLETTLKEDETTLHKKIDRFGIRKFEATDSQMLLNGEPVRLVGFNRISDHRYWGSSEPEKLLALDVDLMKTAGANFMRIMHGTQNKKLIELCDEKGILIFEEANIRDIRNPEFTLPDYGFAKQWVREMIMRDTNHPSIVGWSVGNELKDHYDYVKDLYNYAKSLDPNRMALHVSYVGHRKGENPSNNPLNFGDMIFQNIYHAKPTVVMDTVRKRWPNKAMFISEFGYAVESRFTSPSLDHSFQGLADWYQHFRGQRPYITGASIWSYNDYRSGYTQSLPSENRAWGMVNAWRTKRRYFKLHQNENSPAKALIVDNITLKKRRANVSILLRKPDDFPSYTMKNYTLRYTFFNQKNIPLFNKEEKLPTLSPNTGSWKGGISWKKLKDIPYKLLVELVTPNGYTRREKTLFFDVPKAPKIENIKASDNKVRVYFKRNLDAEEYYISYTINNTIYKSEKTIANYIDLEQIPSNSNVIFSLVAVNSKGDSPPSKPATIVTKGKPLAPIIWDGFIEDNMLVVGYSGAWEDQNYTVRYGINKNELSKTFTTKTKGMTTIPLQGEKQVFFQIKRTTNTAESQWSNRVKAEKGKFRMYE